MKRLLTAIILFSTMLFSSACAMTEQAVAKAVLSLCENVFPGYSVLTKDGYDDGTNGQWALVLAKDGDNALVIAERFGGGGYALTVVNPDAVPDEGEGYSRDTHTIRVSLTKEDRNDRLSFFEMTIAQPDVEKWIITSELMTDGQTWGNVISEYTTYDWDGRTVWWSHISAGDRTLNYMRHQETSEGKPLSTTTYPRVPVKGIPASAHLLEQFDAGRYPYIPDYMNAEQLSDYAGEHVPYGYELIQLDLQPNALILLVDSAQGSRSLRIMPHENWQFRETIITKPLPQTASLDLFHAEEGALQLEWYDGKHDVQFGFSQKALGVFTPSWLQVDGDTDSTNYLFTYNSIACTEDTHPLSNDGVHYGDHPFQRIESIDFTSLPITKDAMLAHVDGSRYAVVNNPNPEDRLHLRERPDKTARSFGKFYNRTPVRVHEIDGEWSKVSIGSDGLLTGYMMTKYLAFGDEMNSVACAFPQLFIQEHLDYPLPLVPYSGGGTTGVTISRDSSIYIIGIHESNYIILTEDGDTGYLLEHLFYPGNG